MIYARSLAFQLGHVVEYYNTLICLLMLPFEIIASIVILYHFVGPSGFGKYCAPYSQRRFDGPMSALLTRFWWLDMLPAGAFRHMLT